MSIDPTCRNCGAIYPLPTETGLCTAAVPYKDLGFMNCNGILEEPQTRYQKLRQARRKAIQEVHDLTAAIAVHTKKSIASVKSVHHTTGCARGDVAPRRRQMSDNWLEVDCIVCWKGRTS